MHKSQGNRRANGPSNMNSCMRKVRLVCDSLESFSYQFILNQDVSWRYYNKQKFNIFGAPKNQSLLGKHSNHFKNINPKTAGGRGQLDPPTPTYYCVFLFFYFDMYTYMYTLICISVKISSVLIFIGDNFRRQNLVTFNQRNFHQ